MRGLYSNFKKYRPFLRAGVQGLMAYRMDFLIYRLGDIMGAIVTFFLWQAVFLSSPRTNLNGFTVQEMTLYVFLSFFTSQLSYSDGAWALGDEVKDGSVAMRLLKPVNFNATFLFNELGGKSVAIGMLSVPIFGGVLLYQFLHPATVSFSFINFALFLLSSIFAYFINFYFNLCYGFTAFVFQNLWGANVLKSAVVAFMSGSLIPLSFFPPAIGHLLSLLPFSSLIYTPVMIYLGKENTSQILIAFAIQVVWLLIFMGLSKLIWRYTITRLNVQGVKKVGTTI
nr:ABC-2 family transporter protein [Lactococcus protaetiae]